MLRCTWWTTSCHNRHNHYPLTSVKLGCPLIGNGGRFVSRNFTVVTECPFFSSSPVTDWKRIHYSHRNSILPGVWEHDYQHREDVRRGCGGHPPQGATPLQAGAEAPRGPPTGWNASVTWKPRTNKPPCCWPRWLPLSKILSWQEKMLFLDIKNLSRPAATRSWPPCRRKATGLATSVSCGRFKAPASSTECSLQMSSFDGCHHKPATDRSCISRWKSNFVGQECLRKEGDIRWDIKLVSIKPPPLLCWSCHIPWPWYLIFKEIHEFTLKQRIWTSDMLYKKNRRKTEKNLRWANYWTRSTNATWTSQLVASQLKVCCYLETQY